MPRQREDHKDWYKLDNAGVLYTALQKEEYSALYRFSAVMDRPVDPAALQRALDKTMPRFPSFRVRMRRGYFWNYLEFNDAPGPFVKEDMSNPCQPVRYREDSGWLIRFFYYERRISLEVFHAVSDGAGSLVLFRTLLAVYLRELGHEIPNTCGVRDVDTPPEPEELEDAYARYIGKTSLHGGRERTAYPNTGTPEPFYTLNTTMGFVSVAQVKEKAKSYGASVTEYLTAVLIQTILDKQHRENPRREKPVALAIPIDLRSFFPSETVRNFILTARPSIDPALGEYSFPEIVAQVHHYLRLNVNRQRLRAVFTGNVRYQSNKLFTIIPSIFKNRGVSFVYKSTGVRPYSGTYTNLGVFQVSPEMAAHIERMEIILGQATVPRVHCASISCGDILNITFAGTLCESDTEREFFRFLVREGIHVRVESNRRCDPKGGSPCPTA